MVDEAFRRSHAVVIGIDSYPNGVPTLTTAVADAREVARILTHDHGYDVDARFESDVTLGALTRLLDNELPRRVSENDRMVLYFAGHGLALSDPEGPAGCLVPYDGRLGDHESMLSMRYLHGALDKPPCRHLLVILDCCFAGAFRWSATRDLVATPVLYRERYDRFVRHRAWQVLTSAAYDEQALDVVVGDTRGTVEGHSPFAAALIAGLGGAADTSPRDGVVTATELYLYVRGRVEPMTVDIGRRQTPGLWPLTKHDRGEFVFHSPGREPDLAPAPRLTPEANPYRGLEPFGEAHRELFFGRAALSDELTRFVAEHALTVVLGASGSGKSSLVGAGVAPRLRDRGFEVIGPLRPGEAPRRAVHHALGSHHDTLADALQACLDDHSDRTLVLIIDPLDEVVMMCRDDAEQRRFTEELAASLDRADRLRIIVTLRSDFEPHFFRSALAPRWTTARFLVPAMVHNELREAIERPASTRALWFEPAELVDRLVNEVIQMPGALPLLSFTLSELYRSCVSRDDEGRALRTADYEAIGGVIGSITHRATAVYERIVSQHLPDLVRQPLERSAEACRLRREVDAYRPRHQDHDDLINS